MHLRERVAFSIRCPRCKAPIGVPCFTATGRPASRVHSARFFTAIDDDDVVANLVAEKES